MENRIGFGRRLGAFLLDIVFIAGLAFILSSLMNDFFQNFVDVSEEEYDQVSKIYGNFTDMMLAMGVSASLVSFLYNLVEGFTGYTIGKLILGIQVGNQDGTVASQNQLMIRFGIKNISGIIGLIGIALSIKWIGTVGSVFGFVILIGCFFVLAEAKLAFHDMLAKTAVFRKNELKPANSVE
ncbi:MAG: RDD family protein [Salinivirgaceae bacterium]|jgi:uncharacterized RDD family membrane protein YckC